MKRIGILLFRLKRPLSIVAMALLLVESVLQSPAFALNRELASTEVAKLEANMRRDPQNLASAKFLIQHYFTKKQWANVIRLSQPLINHLDRTQLLLLTKAYIFNDDGVAAENILATIYGKYPITAETKLLEAQAKVLVARKEHLSDQKKIKATQAIDILRQGIAADTTNTDLYLYWVDILREFWTTYASDALNVIKEMEVATDDYESNIPLKCELYEKANLWDQAVTVCKRAINENPKDLASALSYIEAQKIKEGLEKARELLVRLAEKNPNSYDVQFRMAELYYQEKNYVAAIPYYKKVLSLDQKNIEPLLHLAESEFQTKQYATALVDYQAHCKKARMVTSEFKEAAKKIRSDAKLNRKFETAMASCR
ncbi:MAG: tetratricopeptide repeat protein [Bdellovibrionaceae bacterium]|nr:tetratricopeptide repeat protein [Pseudobdellovibrionaceae bacterium]